jgi:hypothetical protein
VWLCFPPVCTHDAKFVQYPLAVHVHLCVRVRVGGKRYGQHGLEALKCIFLGEVSFAWDEGLKCIFIGGIEFYVG